MTAEHPTDGGESLPRNETDESQLNNTSADIAQHDCHRLTDTDTQNETRVMTDGGRDTHVVRYVEYQGEGYMVYQALTSDLLLLTQPHEDIIEAPVEECTPTDVYGNSLDTDGLILKPRRVWSEYNDHDEFDRDDDGPDRRVMTDGGVDDHNGVPFGGDSNEDADAETDTSSSDDSGPKGSIEDEFPATAEDDPSIVTGDETENESSSADESSSEDDTSSDEEDHRDETVELLEQYLEAADGEINDEHAAFKMGRELGIEPEDALERIEEVAVRDGQTIVNVARHGLPTNTDSSVESWEQIRSMYQAEPDQLGLNRQGEVTKKARKELIGFLEDRYEFLFYRKDRTDEEVLCMRDKREGQQFFEWDCEEWFDKMMMHKLGEDIYDTGEDREIWHIIKKKYRVGYDDVNARHVDRALVPVKNGVLCVDKDGYDPETGEFELLEHDSEYRFLYCLDVEYDPDANREFMARYLHSLFQERHKPLVLGEIFGASLVPDQRFKSFALLAGETDSGNSKAMAAIKSLFPDNARASIDFQDLADDDFAPSDLVGQGGKQINIGTDIPSKQVTDTGLIKQLTSDDDESSVQAKFGKRFDVDIEAFQLHNTNEEFFIKNGGGSMANRLKYLRFDYQFKAGDEYDPENPQHKQADLRLREKLTSEAGKKALLLEALEGLIRLYENGKNFSYEKSSDERWNEYKSMADTTGRFLIKCTENDYDTRDVINGSDPLHLRYDWLYEAYKQWCDANDEDPRPKPKFSEYINKSTEREIIKERPRIGPDDQQIHCKKYLKFSDFGWEYASTPAKRKMAAKYGLGPMADEESEGGDASSAPDASASSSSVEAVATDGGSEATEKVLRQIALLELRESRPSSFPVILSSVELDKGEVEDAVEQLTIDEKIEFDHSKGQYRTTTDVEAVTDADDEDDDTHDEEESSSQPDSEPETTAEDDSEDSDDTDIGAEEETVSEADMERDDEAATIVLDNFDLTEDEEAVISVLESSGDDVDTELLAERLNDEGVSVEAMKTALHLLMEKDVLTVTAFQDITFNNGVSA